MIVTTLQRLTALDTLGLDENPFVTGAGHDGTATTAVGTEVLAASNAQTGTTFDYWTATPASGEATWQVDLAEAKEVASFGFASHDLSGTTVFVERSDDATTWVEVDTASITGAAPVFFRFVPVLARYWRLRITEATGDVSVGVIWLGREIIIPRRTYSGATPVLTPNNVELVSNVSQGRHLLGSASVNAGSMISASFDNVDPAFLRSDPWREFQTRFNEGFGTFFAWRPRKYTSDIVYCSRAAQLAPDNNGVLDLMSFNFKARAHVE